jgi:hypothetical protein
MNESEFEQELRALQPHAPSPTLARRIAAEMPAAQALVVAPSRALSHTPAAGLVVQPRRSPWLGLMRGLLWASAGAALAVVIMTYREPPQFVVDVSRNGVGLAESASVNETPSESVSELISANDEGLIYDQGSAEPQRQMRLNYLERHVWTNPQTGAVIEFEVPREDIVLMPVAMQ